MPSVVQQSLYDAGLITHPYLGTVENDLLWISEHPWDYALYFDADKKMFDKDQVELVFEGLDTYAEVSLNGEPLFVADNQFREWKSEVKSRLKEKDNLLEVHFIPYDSAQLALYEHAEPRFPEKYAVSRKAAYQHGWDWAPKYKNVGIWKPVKLLGWSKVKLEDAYIVTESANIDIAHLSLHLDIYALEDRDVTLEVKISCDSASSAETVFSAPLRLEPVGGSNGPQHCVVPITLSHPELWWPNEMGEQALYRFSVYLKDDSRILDFNEICSGIKTFEMVDEPDSIGRAFYFKVNGKPFYAKGANYIPEEMIETWEDVDNTLRIIRNAKDAHFNMLRVWGGGIYPSDAFFTLCDRFGILVWEDFMYAGSMYPYDSAFLRNVTIEAEQQVRRLASHPSLALWCGGNEISEGYYNWGWQQSLGWSEADDKAMKAGYDTLFEQILPHAVAQYDGTRPYWPSSPSKGWGRPESLTEGDVHYWGVWWGELPYEMYREKVGRFNSEYGYQSYPDLLTLQRLDPDATLEVGCALVEAHQKHAKGTRQIDDFVQRYFPNPVDFSDYVYMSQLSQAYGMEIAIQAHRTAKPYNMGTLYWQLNDSWPVVSWSSIDYYGNKKALQYKLNTLYALVLLSLDPNDFGVFVTSDLYEPLSGTLKTKVCNFKGEALLDEETDIEIADFKNVKYQNETLSALLQDVAKEDVYVKLQFADATGVVAERYCYLAYPKDLSLEEASLTVNAIQEAEGWLLEVTTDAFAKDVVLHANGMEGDFSDNFFDMEAGETRRVSFQPNNTADKVGFSVRCLNQFMSR